MQRKMVRKKPQRKASVGTCTQEDGIISAAAADIRGNKCPLHPTENQRAPVLNVNRQMSFQSDPNIRRSLSSDQSYRRAYGKRMSSPSLIGQPLPVTKMRPRSCSQAPLKIQSKLSLNGSPAMSPHSSPGTCRSHTSSQELLCQSSPHVNHPSRPSSRPDSSARASPRADASSRPSSRPESRARTDSTSRNSPRQDPGSRSASRTDVSRIRADSVSRTCNDPVSRTCNDSVTRACTDSVSRICTDSVSRMRSDSVPGAHTDPVSGTRSDSVSRPRAESFAHTKSVSRTIGRAESSPRMLPRQDSFCTPPRHNPAQRRMSRQDSSSSLMLQRLSSLSIPQDVVDLSTESMPRHLPDLSVPRVSLPEVEIVRMEGVNVKTIRSHSDGDRTLPYRMVPSAVQPVHLDGTSSPDLMVYPVGGVDPIFSMPRMTRQEELSMREIASAGSSLNSVFGDDSCGLQSVGQHRRALPPRPLQWLPSESGSSSRSDKESSYRGSDMSSGLKRATNRMLMERTRRASLTGQEGGSKTQTPDDAASDNLIPGQLSVPKRE